MGKATEPQWWVGLDLGDRMSRYAIVDQEGELIEEASGSICPSLARQSRDREGAIGAADLLTIPDFGEDSDGAPGFHCLARRCIAPSRSRLSCAGSGGL